jgi:hypothetical protein
VKSYSQFFETGGKDMMTTFNRQFLLSFLFTFEPVFYSLLKNFFIEMGGKDKGRSLAAKCFY